MEQRGGETILAEVLNQDLFRCGTCLLEFNDLPAFLMHKEDCNKEQEVIAEQVEESVSVCVTQTPLYKEPLVIDGLTCHLCLKRFKKKYNLSQHLLIHSDTKAFACQICSQRFVQKANLKKHLRKHTSFTKKPNHFDEAVDLEIRTKKGKKVEVVVNKTFGCGFCAQQFSKLADLRAHSSIQHSNEKTFKCPYCDYETFENYEGFSAHLQLEHNVETLPVTTCNVCNIEFESPTELAKHNEKVVHGIDCPKCGEHFALEKYLNRHLKVCSLDASSKEEFKCWLCPKMFSQQQYLRKHLATHSSDTFECLICKKTFKRADNLKRHTKVHEDAAKKYTCPFRSFSGCKKQFFRYDKLKDHIKTHGE